MRLGIATASHRRQCCHSRLRIVVTTPITSDFCKDKCIDILSSNIIASVEMRSSSSATEKTGRANSKGNCRLVETGTNHLPYPRAKWIVVPFAAAFRTSGRLQMTGNKCAYPSVQTTTIAAISSAAWSRRKCTTEKTTDNSRKLVEIAGSRPRLRDCKTRVQRSARATRTHKSTEIIQSRVVRDN